MNTKWMKASTGIILMALLVSACGVIPTMGSRNLVSEDRPVSGYDHLSVSGAGDVTILQDGTEALTIETDDNVMQYVTTEVRGGTLDIGLDFPDLHSVIPSAFHVTLHVKDLSGISASGSWEVNAAALETTNLDIEVSGSAKVTVQALVVDALKVGSSGGSTMDLAGRATSQEIDISGSATYRAGDLQTQDTRISVSGSGNVTVWATGFLNGSISGSGTISYYGAPQVTFDQSGSGKVKSLGDK